MRVFNKDKTEELTEYDLNLGELVDDVLVIRHEKVEPIKEESHYEVVKEYENGGQDVEKVIDVQGVEGKDAYEETEQIKVYIPFTEEKIKRKAMEKELDEIEKWFSWYDVQTIQYARATRQIAELDKMAEVKAKRINEIREELKEENNNDSDNN